MIASKRRAQIPGTACVLLVSFGFAVAGANTTNATCTEAATSELTCIAKTKTTDAVRCVTLTCIPII